MYKYVLLHGYRDFAVFPLQLLPTTATARDVLYAEQQWMHRFNSMVPNGYNAHLAHYDVPVPSVPCTNTARVNIKHLCRRVFYCCNESWVRNTLTANSHTHFFATYLTATLKRMYSFCCRGGGEGGVSVTDPLGRWRVPCEFLDILRPWLQHDILDLCGGFSKTRL
jgi:hypothetical protein